MWTVTNLNKKTMSRTTAFLDENQDMQVTIVPGAYYNIGNVISDVFRAVNSQFLTSTWSDGMPKEFFDVSKVMAINIKHGTDLDTKNISIEAENQQAIGVVGVLKPIIQNHLKVEDYASLLNSVRDELVDFGHVILKKTSEGTETVDLRNVVRPAHILDVQKGGLIEKHEWTYSDMLQRKSKFDKWEEVETLWEKMKTQGLSTFQVYEHWLIDDFDGQVTKGVIMSLDREIMKPEDGSEPSDWDTTVELSRTKTPYTKPIADIQKKKELEKSGFLIDGEEPLYPYEDIRFVTVKGRWLGAGVYEITAPVRRAYNRTLNVKLRYDEIQTKGTFLHTKGINGKSLTQEAINALESTGVVDLQNGAQLEQLRIQSLTNEFINSADKFFEFARQLLGLTAQGTGEDLPANMPATTAVINDNRAKTLFDSILETQGIAWRNWFSDFELDDILDNLSAKKWAKIQGSEEDLIEVITPFAIKYLKMDQRFQNMVSLGRELKIMEAVQPAIDKVQKELVKDNIMNGTAFVAFKKSFLKNAQFFIDFVITNEASDKQAEIVEMQALHDKALINPASSLSPAKLEEGILNKINQDAKRFKKTKEESAIINNPQLNANLPQPGQANAPQAPPQAVQPPQQR